MTKDSLKKGSPAGAIELVLGVLLIILWCVGSIESFKAEALAVRVVPWALRLGYEEKKSLMDGHIYELTKSASSMIPPRSAVYLFTPTAGEKGSYYFLKARYYLYPRKVIDGGSIEFRSKELSGSDYLVVYIPKRSAYGGADDFELLPYLEKVYSKEENEGYEAFYKVKKGPGL